ncbi:MAG: hypothetical protein KDD92_00205 [Caldilineaceae bacterium]|nr:hypothetical protein [Caldilineaceae bacterium]
MNTIAFFAIARPTFDVPLAQSMADAAVSRLEDAGYRVTGTRTRLLMDGADAAEAAAYLDTAWRADEGIDLVILFQASFADSLMSVEIARAAQPSGAPLLLWAVPDVRDGGRLRLNSLCGINLAGHALTQQGIAYHHLLASPHGSMMEAGIDPLVAAGAARRMLAGARIGVVGDYPPGFDTCAYDSAHLQRLFGIEIEPVALHAAFAKAAAVPLVAREQVLAQIAAIAPDVAALDQAAAAGTASVYCALNELAGERQMSGLAVRCWPEFFTELGCAACGAMSMLNEEGCPASCEADVNGTVTSLLLQALAGSQAFIADLVSIDPESDTGVLWHCGLAPVSMADPEAPVSATVHSNRKLPLLFEFPLKPGRITLARLHRHGLSGGLDDYRLVIAGGEMVRSPGSYGGTSGVVRFDDPAMTVLDRIMQYGLEHHVSLVYGDVRAGLRAFARLVGLGVIELTEKEKLEMRNEE